MPDTPIYMCDALMDDIKVNGIQEPIKYVEYNGQKYVVDGHHRLLAAKRLGLTEVPIERSRVIICRI